MQMGLLDRTQEDHQLEDLKKVNLLRPQSRCVQVTTAPIVTTVRKESMAVVHQQAQQGNQFRDLKPQVGQVVEVSLRPKFITHSNRQPQTIANATYSAMVGTPFWTNIKQPSAMRWDPLPSMRR